MHTSDSGRRRSKSKEYDHFIKVVVVGRSGVGKSAVMLRFCEDSFIESHVNTIGVDFRFKTIEVQQKKVKVQIWDTAGQEKFRTISSSYYRGADAVVLVYDITSAKSLEDLKSYWIQEVEQHGLEIPNMVLVGNKIDLHDLREVPSFKEKLYPLSFGALNREARIYEVSAKDDIGVKQIFHDLALKYIQARDAKKAGKSMMLRSIDQPLELIKEEDENSGSNSYSSAGERAKKLRAIQLEAHVESPTSYQKLTLSGYQHQSQQRAGESDTGCSC
jgi:small GTP-binding protein